LGVFAELPKGFARARRLETLTYAQVGRSGYPWSWVSVMRVCGFDGAKAMVVGLRGVGFVGDLAKPPGSLVPSVARFL